MTGRCAAALLLIVATACGEPPSLPGPNPLVLTPEPPVPVTFQAGAAPVQVAVRVTDAAGAPSAGVQVTWLVGQGGQIAPASATSGPDGVVATSFTATTPGTIVVRAAAGGADSLDLPIQVTAGPPAAMAIAGGDAQNGVSGEVLGAPFVAEVRDAFGNLVAGAPVAWTVTAGGGTLVTSPGVTDPAGRTSALLRLGAVGAQAVQVAATGTPAVTVTFTATAGPGIALVTSVPMPANYGIHDQYVRDGYAFVCAWNSGLMIYDVGAGTHGGSPLAPVLVSTIVTAAGGVPGGAAVHNAWWYHAPDGQKRYVFVGQEGPGVIGSSASGDLHVVDITNINAPVEVASYRLPGAGAHNVWVDESAEILYVAYYNGGVVALNVAGTLSGNLASREIARIQPGGAGGTYVWGVQLLNGSLYVNDMLSGFWQLRLVGSAFQILSGGNNVPERFGSDLWVHGSYAYTGTWNTRTTGGIARQGNVVKVWSLGPAGAPTLADSVVVQGVGTISDVEVTPEGDLLMLSAEGGTNPGVYLYSLSDPRRPRFLTYHRVATGVHTTTFARIAGRRYAFAARNPSNPALLILDVTDIVP